MVLYARSDVASALVPAEIGGCGRPGGHSRPVNGGAPQHPWGLTCDPCENYLRVHNSDMWSATPSDIPETYDEKHVREDFERRGARDKDAVLTLALARIAGLTPDMLPESLTRMITGQPAHLPATATAMLECVNGHASPPGQRFCGECGAPLATPVSAGSLTAPPPVPVSEQLRENGLGPDSAVPDGVTKGRRSPRLRDQPKVTLQALAKERGIDTSGSNADLVSRLAGAGVTNNDLSAYLATV